MSLKALYLSPVASFPLHPGSKTGIQDQAADPRDKGESRICDRLSKIVA